MPTNRDMEYILRMRQMGFESIDAIKGRITNLTQELQKVKIGSDRFSELTEKIHASQSAIDGARAKYEQYSSVSERAAAFRKEQIKDQRVQNFFFRETQQALGAVSLGLAAFNGAAGESSKQATMLSNSLNQGFLAFQGLDFLMAGIGGPAGAAVAAIGGVGAAMLSMHQQAEQARLRIGDLRERLLRLQVELGEASRAELIAFLNNELIKMRTNFGLANVAAMDWLRTLASFGFLSQVKDNTEEVLQLSIRIAEITKTLREVRKEAAADEKKEMEENAKAIDKYAENIDR